jgi:hypothetical protein
MAKAFGGCYRRRETLVRLAGKELAEADKVLRRHRVLSICAAAWCPKRSMDILGLEFESAFA